MGVPSAAIDGALRFSWYHDTKLDNVARMVSILRQLQSHANG